MKKTWICALLALLLCLSLGAPALADDAPEEIWYFYDTVGVTSSDEDEIIEKRLNELSQGAIACYAVIVEGYAEYGDDLRDAAENIYVGMDFGNGDEHNGVLLLAESETRQGVLCVHGAKAEVIFTEAAQQEVLDEFDGTDGWYQAMIAYADICGHLLNGVGVEESWRFYDVSGVMSVDENYAIEAQFTRLSETYGVGVYGVILPDSAEYGDSLANAAANIYGNMDFGEGEEREGVLLLADTGANAQTLYVHGPKAKAIFTDAAAQELLERFAANLPLYQDAMGYYGDDCEALLAKSGLAGTETDSRTSPEETAAPAATPTAETPAPAGTQAPAGTGDAEAPQRFLYDVADLLTDAQEDALEAKLRRISESYNCGVYIAAVRDYTDYGGGSIEDVSESLYFHEGFGYGPNSDGMFLLLSMDERDYDFFRNSWGNIAVTTKAKDEIIAAFKDDFRNDDWNAGLNDFADECERMLSIAAAGEPYGSGLSTGAKVAIIAIPALLIAGIACGVMLAKMRSVRKAADADAYTTPGSLNITDATDIFTHTTETRRKIESSSRSGGGGGGSSHSSGKF